MPKKILLTGGMGFIGLNLLSLLIKSTDYELILLDRTEYKFNNPRIQTVMCDLLAVDETVFSKVGYIDDVILLAASSEKDKDLEFSTKINVNANVTIVENLLKNNPRLNVIFASSQQVYGDSQEKSESNTKLNPKNNYAITKLQCEKKLMELDSTYSILRISNPYGAHIPVPTNYNYANQLLRNLYLGEEIELYNNGEIKKNYIPVTNLANIITSCITNDDWKNQVWNVGHFEDTTLLEFFSEAKELFGKGKISLISNNFTDDPVQMNVNKLYNLIDKTSLLSTTEALTQFKKFFDSNELVTPQTFI